MSDKKNEITTTASDTVNPATAPTQDALTAKVIEAGGDETVVAKLKDMGVASVDDLSMLEVNDLREAGFKLVQARKLKAGFTAAEENAKADTSTETKR